jgi:hypothetical protein
MKQLEIRKYLFDINEACELLVRFTTGKTFPKGFQIGCCKCLIYKVLSLPQVNREEYA